MRVLSSYTLKERLARLIRGACRVFFFAVGHIAGRQPLNRAAQLLVLLAGRRAGWIVMEALALSAGHQAAIRLCEARARKLLDSGTPPRPPRQAAAPAKPPPKPLSPEAKAAALRHSLSVLEGSGLKPFICFGSLLGLVRENGFMPHDDDIDIGIFYEAGVCEKVRLLLKRNGFDILLHEKDPWPCMLKVRWSEQPVVFDIVFFNPSGAFLQTYSRILNHLLIRNRTPFALKRVMLEGVPAWIPDPPEVFLNENYRNWKARCCYHHYILTSPLTDFSDPVVQLFLSFSLWNALRRGDADTAKHLAKIGQREYKENAFWSRV
jgi:hypothetical protein